MFRGIRSAGLLAGLALVAGCAAHVPVDTRALIDPQTLIAAAPLGELAAGGEPPDADILGVDVEMRGFLAAQVDPAGAPEARLVQLLRAVVDQPAFRIVYEDRTSTAAETFRRREANCLSFTNLFIALARESGIPAVFQEVDVPPDWELRTEVMIVTRHIDVLVPGRDGHDRVVDFDMADFRTTYDRRVISDARARAHFYSNLAAERLQAQDTAGALGYLRKSLAADAGFEPAWVNLGTLYLRAGYPAWARAAWWQALAVRPGEEVALSNLERSYRLAGDAAMADVLLARIEGFRAGNPYYRYFLARRAYEAGDFATAIGHLRFALRQKPAEDRFAALLGLSYLGRGDAGAAERWLAQAEALAEDGATRAHYHGKLERLRRHGGAS